MLPPPFAYPFPLEVAVPHEVFPDILSLVFSIALYVSDRFPGSNRESGNEARSKYSGAYSRSHSGRMSVTVRMN